MRPSKPELDRDLDRRITARIAELNAARCEVCNAPLRTGLVYCGGSLACWKKGEGIVSWTDDDMDVNGLAAPLPEGVCATKGCPLTGAHLHEQPRPEARAAEALLAMGVKPPVETVNHPSHYGGDTPYEVIKVLEAWDPVMAMGFCWGNTIKYFARAGKKTSADGLEDFKKGTWYANKFVEIKERAK